MERDRPNAPLDVRGLAVEGARGGYASAGQGRAPGHLASNFVGLHVGRVAQGAGRPAPRRN
eukprot:1672493-Lingulodinium_polyedra.AAC.1